MESYIRKINYYETDKMGITHHSNYIRIMEEARVHFLEQIGCGYTKMEEDGIISPVVSVECKYNRPTTFGNTLRVQVEIVEYKRLLLTVSYKMYNTETEELCVVGKSRHCFVNAQGKPISLKKTYPQYDAIFSALCKDEE
ncbi:MAG: acyl-CoA thioesterase [Clostridia bacterium]|nr:acyl-CoA thioesterase [Clostridia bacterium]